ncbi:MAG: hypothetical protein AAGA92_05080 [Planctomycetota bacterium]
MASPFTYFRKYQKVFLAVAGVLAIVVFVFADALSNLVVSAAGGDAGAGKSIVASWNGGELTERKFARLVQRRSFVSSVLQRLQMTGVQRVYEAGQEPTEPSVPNFVIPEQTDINRLQQEVVNTHVMADLAQEAGMTVSDGVILHYLQQMGFERVEESEIPAILEAAPLQASAQFKENWLFAGLRELLLADQYTRTFGSAIATPMPMERWIDWTSVNERVAVEAAVIPADTLLAEVPEPTDAEVAAFYDEHKERLAGVPDIIGRRELPAATPGFRRPERVVLKYLVGDPVEWSQKYIDEITDEEIADYYERNKRSEFVMTDFGSDFATEFDDDLFMDEGEGEEEGEPAEEAAPEGDVEGEEAAEAESGVTEEPAAEAADTEAVAEEAATEEEEEEEEADASDESADESPSGEGEGESADGANAAEEGDAAADEDVKYQPLEEVADQIRARLANDRAVVELEKVAQGAYSKLKKSYSRYGLAVVEAQAAGEPAPEPPAELQDLSALAKETGLTIEETLPLSQLGVRDTPVGLAVDTRTGDRLIVQAVFGKRGTDLYEPILGRSQFDGIWYITLKTTQTPDTVPPLEEIRDEVVEEWKAKRAGELALERAKKLASDAEQSSQTLEQIAEANGLEVVTTDLFSRLTLGTAQSELQRGARLGEAPPLQDVGQQFLDDVFGLVGDSVGGTHNHDQSAAYVVRVAQRESTEAGLRSRFLREANTWSGAMPMMRARLGATQRNVVQKLLADRAGLDLEQVARALQPRE